MRLELLGPFRLSGGGAGAGQLPKKVQGLLAYLGMHGGQPIPREQLAALMWSDNGEDQARHSLRQGLVSLRAALAGAGPKLMFADSATVGMNVSGQLSVDVREFELLARSTNPEKLSAAAKLYRGEFLSGLRVYCEPFSEWVSMERRQLASAMSDVLYRLAGAQVDNIEAAIAAAQQLAAFDPLREDGQRLLIRLLAMAGRRDAALKQYTVCATILDRELGVAPEPETVALAEAVRRGKLAGDTVPLRSAGKLTSSTARKEPAPAQDDSDNEDAVARHAPSDKPSIAVLPFTNLSGDPDQDYFAAGVTEDITGALGREQWLFVISSKSAFTYAGQSLNIQQIGSELDVRYVVRGSLRKSRDRLRIAVQLIDATNNAHIWASRFDGGHDDIFEIQDRVARQVAGTIGPKLRSVEIERVRRKPPASLTAYELFLRAAAMHRSSLTKNREALHLLYKAIEIDPSYAVAYGLAAWCCQLQKVLGWVLPADPAIKEGIRLAYLAAEIGKDDPEALWMAGQTVALLAGEIDHGIALTDKSISLNPNSASAWMTAGTVRAYYGDSARALECLDEARRLNPLDPLPQYTWIGIALAHFFAGRYEEALMATNKALHAQANYAPALRMGAVICGLLGRVSDGSTFLERLLAVNPDATVSQLADYYRAPMCRNPAGLEAYLDGLRRSGLPLG
jgi:TolB-like protein/DNA-binding SARP family transcriptional activator